MKKTIYLGIFLIGVLINLYNFTEVFGDTAIPKFRGWGTSTTLADSTNYLTLNKGFYAFDSIKTDKDLIVKGAIVLDTLRQGKLFYSGNDLTLGNEKTDGSILISAYGTGTDNILIYSSSGLQEYKVGTGSNGYYSWNKQEGLFLTEIARLDTSTGFIVKQGNIQLAGTTQQIKLPSDTATDYDANDAITLNRQSGVLTTKSLTTGTNSLYVLALTNSLITANSKVLASLNDGTVSTGFPMLYQTRPASGSCNIVIWNASGTDAFNGTIKVQYVVFN